MTPYYQQQGVTIYHGDCVAVLGQLEPQSVDSCVTDPPYEIGFMGKQWDASGIAFAPSTWAAVFRVLKPGAHLLAFGGTRSSHRMVCAIEDAGFEIRDSIHWAYGSGFPKSHNISKAMDKAAGAEREVVGESKYAARRPNGVNTGMLSSEYQVANGYRNESFKNPSVPMDTAPATDLAKQWEGWGTALKPAHEPIILARKPLSESSVAANVERWGTGALNVDGCRVGMDDLSSQWDRKWNQDGSFGNGKRGIANHRPPGRWPANLILNHTLFCDAEGCADGCPVALLDGQSGVSVSRRGMMQPGPESEGWGLHKRGPGVRGHSDSGGASRFFHCLPWDPLEEAVPPFLYAAKPAKSERNHGCDNHHPTVKPVSLLRLLTRMVTPPGGTVLDCFAGSGSTGVAAIREGFGFLGMEQHEPYAEIGQARVSKEVLALSA